MASNKYSRGKKLVALCEVNASSKEKPIINICERSISSDKRDEYVCDLTMLFSDDYSMDILTSPLRPVQVHETSPRNASEDLISNSNGDNLTDISYCSLQNVTNEINLSVPDAWLEQNSLNNPSLTSMLLDNDNRDRNVGNVSEISIAETILNPVGRIEQASCSVENVSDERTAGDNITFMLNPETGIFEKTGTGPPNHEIVVPSALPSKIRENQHLRLLGKTYKGSKRQRDPSTSKILSTDVVKKNRAMAEKPCAHEAEEKSDRSFLCGAISDEIRRDIFQYFWNLPSWDAKKSYLNGLVQIRSTLKRRPDLNEESTNLKKNYGFDCFLPSQTGAKVRVCKLFFLATFDLKKDVFQEWIRTTNTTDSSPSNSKIRKIDRCTVPTSTPRVLKSRSVELWLEKVPVVPSHYCRGDSKRTYVEDTFHSKTHMHKVYTLWCQENNLNAATRKLFTEKLEERKISIFKPRKDQCDTCVGYKEGNITEDIYNLHIIKKNEARAAKENAANEISSTVLVVSMDMQSVLLSPKLLVSEQYYKQKLAVHNYTFYVKNDKNVYLYVWHEGEGGVAASNITSCIINFLKEHCYAYKKVYLISDGCCYQNRNKVLSSALSNASTSLGIEIEQLILEKGHTMMEVDSVHSTLENQLRPPIYAPTDYITHMRQARPTQPYIVNYLDHSFFLNYEEVPGNFISIRPGKRSGDPTVTDIRSLWYKDGEVKYKLRHTDIFTLLPQRRPEQREYHEALPLYNSRPKIDKAKYNSLQSLKVYMHKDYHNFYDNLNV